MELVIDANAFISALVSTQGKTADIIFKGEVTLFAPDFLWSEVEEHWKEILLKSNLNEEDLRKALVLLASQITFFPFSEYNSLLQFAKKISPDPDDVAYIALALKMRCPLWSNDKLLKSQTEVKVLSTSELIQMIS